jgi:hypothetical protein
MAGIPSQALATFDGWPQGINNRAKEEVVPSRALRAAVNVDLDADGKPQRRPGFELALPLAGLHSLWAHDRFALMLGVQGGTLVGMDFAEDAQVIGDALLTPDAPMSYDLIAGAVYYSNGTDCGTVQQDGSVRAWATEQPAGPPNAVPNAGAGGLVAGTYQVAITFLDVDGRESAASFPVEVDVAQGQGILLSQFPAAVDPRTALVRVYCSKPNGGPLYYVQDLPVGLASFLLGAHQSGKMLDRLFLATMPAGQIVRGHGGRQFVAVRNRLLWSEALMYGLYKPHENWVTHDGDVTLVETAGEAQGAGLFVATAAGQGKGAGRTYFLTGPDPKNWQRVIAYPHGAVPGSARQFEASALGIDGTSGLLPVWLSDHGQFVVGLPSGAVLQLHADRYVAPKGAEHASLALREVDGMRHLIATLRGGQVSGLAAVDVAEAEVWKDGKRIS